MIWQTVKRHLMAFHRDERGAALVTTLAVFMFIYLLFIGIFAVGTNVRTRIHLQNACDAAAYSAAVVQADTLSRIATINRAMSWTYAEMTKRQMDYLVWNLMENTRRSYYADRATAMAIHAGSGCWQQHKWEGTNGGWFIGADGRLENVKINGSQYANITRIDSACTEFNQSWMNRSGNRPTFYAQTGVVGGSQLLAQINTDAAVIARMTAAEQSLAKQLPSRITATVRDVVNANLPDDLRGAATHYVERCDSPLSSSSGYLQGLASSTADERRFLWFGGYYNGGFGDIQRTHGRFSPSSQQSVFDTGHSTWFPLLQTGTGFRRAYRAYAGCLSTQWNWWSAFWNCYLVRGKWVHISTPPLPQLHPHYNGLTADLLRTVVNREAYDCGTTANPLVLNARYFGDAGTITVGLATKNANPWEFTGGTSSGIFSAFNPFVPRTVCLSSAKAGYKFIGDEYEANGDRQYRVDWRDGAWNAPEQSWNLCQSDWDAVLIPVRMAKTPATNGSWGGMVTFLSDFVMGKLHVNSGEFLAGGTHDPREENWDEIGEMRRWNGSTFSANPDYENGKVRAKWQIGNPGAPVNWNGLQNRMWH